MNTITKRSIAKAFVDLLEEKPFEKITIQDISAKAGVNRQTFYYHFLDIRDLIEWIMNTSEQEIIAKNKENIENKSWENGFITILDEISKNKNLIYAISQNMEYSKYVTEYLLHLTFNYIYGVVVSKSKEMNVVVKEEDMVFIANFYKYAFLGVLLEWIKVNFKDDPKVMVSKLDIMIKGTLENSLSNYDQKHMK